MRSLIRKETHYHHLVQWVTWEAMQYRLYCITCRRYLDHYTQNPATLVVFEFEEL